MGGCCPLPLGGMPPPQEILKILIQFGILISVLYYKWEQVVMVFKRQKILFHVFQLIISLNAQERKENE